MLNVFRRLHPDAFCITTGISYKPGSIFYTLHIVAWLGYFPLFKLLASALCVRSSRLQVWQMVPRKTGCALRFVWADGGWVADGCRKSLLVEEFRRTRHLWSHRVMNHILECPSFFFLQCLNCGLSPALSICRSLSCITVAIGIS